MNPIATLTCCVAICAAGASLPARSAPGITPTEIVIGHDVDLTGTIAARMKPFVTAADAYFARVNAAGGIHGRRIRVVRTDSGNKPDRTKANVAKLIDNDGVFALWAISGTGNLAVALPVAEEKGVPVIGSTSGADIFYQRKSPVLFNLKASYGDEVRRLIAHFKAVHNDRIGILYLDNGFGRESLKSALEAARRSGVEVVSVAGFKEDGSNIEAAAQAVAKVSPPAVLLITLAGPAPRLVEAYQNAGGQSQLAALNVIASDVLHRAIGDRARGLIVTQVVPLPDDRGVPLIREYQGLMASIGVKAFSPSGVEGFIQAKVLVDALRAAGPALDRRRIVEALEGMRERDLGGFRIAFGPNDHNGSNYVEITMIGRHGRLLR